MSGYTDTNKKSPYPDNLENFPIVIRDLMDFTIGKNYNGDEIIISCKYANPQHCGMMLRDCIDGKDYLCMNNVSIVRDPYARRPRKEKPDNLR